MKRENLYNIYIEMYGEEQQKLMLLEEMAELQKAVLKEIRYNFGEKKQYIENIAEEIADVQIMLEQIISIYKINARVILLKKYKKRRMERRYNNFIKNRIDNS